MDAWIHEPEPEEDGEDVSSEDEGYRFGKKALRSEFATFGGRLRYSSEEEAAAKKSSQASKEPTEEEIRLVSVIFFNGKNTLLLFFHIWS